MSVLTNPFYWLFLLTCAPNNYLKLVPVYIISLCCITHKLTYIFEFIYLCLGDLALLQVTSFEDKTPLRVGVFFFTLFVWLRLVTDEVEFGCKAHWPWIVFPTLGCLVIYFQSIDDNLLRLYILSLSLLLSLRFDQDSVGSLLTDSNGNIKLCWGYFLYVVSDCLLLISLQYRFPYDWELGRIIYWLGLTIVYRV